MPIRLSTTAPPRGRSGWAPIPAERAHLRSAQPFAEARAVGPRDPGTPGPAAGLWRRRSESRFQPDPFPRPPGAQWKTTWKRGAKPVPRGLRFLGSCVPAAARGSPSVPVGSCRGMAGPSVAFAKPRPGSEDGLAVCLSPEGPPAADQARDRARPAVHGPERPLRKPWGPAGASPLGRSAS